MPKKQLLFFLFWLPLPWRRELHILQFHDWNKNAKNLAKVWFSYQGMLDSPKCMWRLSTFFFNLYILVLTLVGAATLVVTAQSWKYLNNFKHVYVCLESFEPYFLTLESSSSCRVILDVPGYSIQQTKAAQQPKLLLTLSFERQIYLYCDILPLLVCQKSQTFLVCRQKAIKQLNAAGI